MHSRSSLILAAAASLAVGALFGPVAPASATEDHHGRGVCRPVLPAGETTVHLVSGGADRTAVVYVPQRVRTKSKRPALVLTLHGSASNGAEQLVRTGLEATADAEGFVVAAPNGLLSTGADTYRWNVPFVTVPDGPDDEQFLLDLIDSLSTSACIDDHRVIASGYSGGARMVSALACDHPDRIAALVAVAGLRYGPPIDDGHGGFVPDTSRCNPDRPVPVLAFGGTADPVNPFGGGGAAYWGYGTIAATQAWAVHDQCRPTPVTKQVTPHVTRVSYRGCKANADVVLYVIEGGGHTWPGSTATWDPALGVVTSEISASALLWDFGRNRHSHPERS
jgi:polyhydroxybutyrate depolymerase